MSPPMEYSFPSTSIVLSEPINPASAAGLFSTTVMIIASMTGLVYPTIDVDVQ